MPPSPSDHRHRTLTNDWLDGSTRFQSRKEYIEYSVTTLRLAPTVANSLADELEEIHEECRCPLPSGLSVKLADEPDDAPGMTPSQRKKEQDALRAFETRVKEAHSE